MQSQSSFDSDEDVFHDTVAYESDDARATSNILLKDGAKLLTVKGKGVADPGDVQQKPVDAAGIADDSKRDAQQQKPSKFCIFLNTRGSWCAMILVYSPCI